MNQSSERMYDDIGGGPEGPRVAMEKHVHASWASTDSMLILKIMDMINHNVEGWHHAALVTLGVNDKTWKVEWSDIFAKAHALYVLDTDNYQAKLTSGPEAALLWEAEQIIKKKAEQPDFPIYVINPQSLEEGIPALAMHLAAGRKDFNFLSWEKRVKAHRCKLVPSRSWTSVFTANPSMTDFMCAISGVVMVDPVKAADNYFYERDKIEEYFAVHGFVSPMTKQKMADRTLVPATGLKEAIETFVKAWLQRQPKTSGQEGGKPEVTTHDLDEVAESGLLSWEPHGQQTEKRTLALSDEAFVARDAEQFADMSDRMSEVFEHLDQHRRLLQSTFADFSPPQIIVIGDESSGKSTVLEQLAMMPLFPRARKFCTRLPIHVQLRRDPERAEAAISVQSIAGTKGKAEEDRRVIPIAQCHEYVQELMDNIEEPGIIQTKKVVLEIYHPNVPSLDLVDLPGLTNTPGRKEEVERTLKTYVDDRSGHAMYLAVVPSAARPNANTAVNFILENNLTSRAFGVFTHCDEPATNRDILYSLVTGEDVGPEEPASEEGYVELKKGWVVTMLKPPGSCTQEKYYKGHNQERLYAKKQAEIEFFSGKDSTEIHRRLFEDGFAGVPVLADRLVHEYYKHIFSSWIPSVLERLESKLAETRFERNMLGFSSTNVLDIQEKAVEEVQRRLTHIQVVYNRYIDEKVNIYLENCMLQVLTPLREQLGLATVDLGELLDKWRKELVDKIHEFLNDHMVKWWSHEVEQLLTDEITEVSENDEISIRTSFMIILGAAKKSSIHERIRKCPPFQLSSYKQYTDAIMERCQDLLEKVAQKIRTQVEHDICDNLFSFSSKWMALSPSKDRKTVDVSFEVEAVVNTLFLHVLSKIPTPKLFADIHLGIDNEKLVELDETANRRISLDDDIQKLKSACDSMRLHPEYKVTKRSAIQILKDIIENQEQMKVYMKDLTKELLSKSLTFEQTYQWVKEVQPADPLEKHGLAMDGFDRLLNEHQGDSEVRELIAKVMGAPTPNSSCSQKVQTITVKTICNVHNFMLEKLDAFVQDFLALPNKSTYDMKTVTIAAQAIVGSKIEDSFGITPDEIEAAVLKRHTDLATNQEFAAINIKIQQTMGKLMGTRERVTAA